MYLLADLNADRDEDRPNSWRPLMPEDADDLLEKDDFRKSLMTLMMVEFAKARAEFLRDQESDEEIDVDTLPALGTNILRFPG